MNGFSLVVIGACATVALAGYVVLLVHSYRQERRLAALTEQMAVFLETSMDVARCVDQLVVGKTDEARATSAPSSRRWLLSEAQERLAHGDELPAIASRLGLSQDEVSLLRVRVG